MTPNDLNRTATKVVIAIVILAGFFVGVSAFVMASVLLGWGAM